MHPSPSVTQPHSDIASSSEPNLSGKKEESVTFCGVTVDKEDLLGAVQEAVNIVPNPYGIRLGERDINFLLQEVARLLKK